MASSQETSSTQVASQNDYPTKETPVNNVQESIQTDADTAAAEAAAAAKAAATAAAEAAKVAEALALEAAKVAEAAAAEKLRLEEEAAALKIKEFVEAQSELYREMHTKIPKVNIHICVKLEELINKKFLSTDDITNSKLNEALKDLNENCIVAFDEFIKLKESKAASAEETVVVSKVEIKSELNESNMEASTTEVLMETSTGVVAENPTVNESINNGEAATTQTVATTTNIPNTKIKSNVDTLSGTLFKWKRSNKDKLTPSSKIQSLLQGQLKNNRKSSERPGPNQEKLKEILARTGYSHEISSGQRKYGGPPPGWSDSNVVKQEDKNMDVSNEAVVADSNEPIKTEDNVSSTPVEATDVVVKKEILAIPPQGCECFVGKLPRDLYEDELIPVFEKHGRIWDLRLMIDPSTGLSKGYCFVTYCEKSDAHAAAKAVR